MSQSDESDRDVLAEILDRAGVVYRKRAYADGTSDIAIEPKAGPNNRGYPDFEASFDFNEAGELLSVTVWE